MWRLVIYYFCIKMYKYFIFTGIWCGIWRWCLFKCCNMTQKPSWTNMCWCSQLLWMSRQYCLLYFLKCRWRSPYAALCCVNLLLRRRSGKAFTEVTEVISMMLGFLAWISKSGKETAWIHVDYLKLVVYNDINVIKCNGYY